MALNDTMLRNLKPEPKPKKLFDGGGLYLHLKPNGSKLWCMAYRYEGKTKTLSFGHYPTISLKGARTRRDDAKALLANGIDPYVEKKQAKERLASEENCQENTFGAIAEEWFKRYSKQISDKHIIRLRRRLDGKILPAIGAKLVTECEPIDFLNIAAIDETAGHDEAARRVIYICNQVMEYARVTGRVDYNKAAGLTKVLAPLKVTHRPAVTDPQAIGQLLRDIDTYKGYFSVVYYLKILPYVFTRPSELRLATWQEIDYDAAIWHVPAARMKMRKDHLVPLARQVIDLLHQLKQYCASDYLFPSVRANSAPISDATALAGLRRMGYEKDEATLHGFRGTASTLLNDMGFRPDIIEMQLAHQDSNKVRAAYNRAERFNERRQMMQVWADYLDKLRAGETPKLSVTISISS